MACRHLWERGRRRVALVLNDQAENDPLMHDRLRGYQLALADAALQSDTLPRVVWHGDGTFPPTAELADQAVAALVAARADAVVASNDVWAIALAKSLRRRGMRVPEEMAVVGFDNLDAAELFDPSLTSIDQNNPAFAAAAIELLLRTLEQGSLPPSRRRVLVEPRLIVREST